MVVDEIMTMVMDDALESVRQITGTLAALSTVVEQPATKELNGY